MKRALISTAMVLAVVFGSVGLASTPARAADVYGTKWHNNSGSAIPWGPYNQTTSNRKSVIDAKSMLRTGTAIGAVALMLCTRAGDLVVASACIFAMTKYGLEFRDAVNSAYNSGNCLKVRFYLIAASQLAARTISSGGCWYPQFNSWGYAQPSCSTNFCGSGGGGAGGGGSWKYAKDPIDTLVGKVWYTHGHAKLNTAPGGAGGGGGGSW